MLHLIRMDFKIAKSYFFMSVQYEIFFFLLVPKVTLCWKRDKEYNPTDFRAFLIVRKNKRSNISVLLPKLAPYCAHKMRQVVSKNTIFKPP